MMCENSSIPMSPHGNTSIHVTYKNCKTHSGAYCIIKTDNFHGLADA